MLTFSINNTITNKKSDPIIINNTKPNKKSDPIMINMKKSLSLDNFWPNTPPSQTPNQSPNNSYDQNFLQKVKNISYLFSNYKKTNPIIKNMNKKLSFDKFWPNTPPDTTPNSSV